MKKNKWIKIKIDFGYRLKKEVVKEREKDVERERFKKDNHYDTKNCYFQDLSRCCRFKHLHAIITAPRHSA